jgi:hypothetical protein
MGLENMIFGNVGKSNKPTAPNVDLFGGMNKAMSSPWLQASKGEQAGMDVMNRMKGNLGGFTSPESSALFGKGMSKIAGAQGQVQNQALRGMAKAGIGGGMAAEATKRMGESAQDKMAELGTDLTIQNIGQKEKALQYYAKQAKNQEMAEMARRGLAGQLSIAEQQALMDKYSADMAAYGAERGDEHGGLLGAALDYYTGGFGGDLYANLMR